MSSFILDILEFLFTVLPWSKRKRNRHEEWSGTVEAKRTWTLSKHAYLVIFRTDDGKKKRVRMDREEDFDIYEKGRRYFKRADRDLPEPNGALNGGARPRDRE